MANSRAALTRLAPIVLGAFGLVMLLLAARSFIGSAGFGYDFDAYYAAARRLATGEPLYPPGLAEAYNSGSYAGLYLYPPPPALSFVPLTGATEDLATSVWLWLRIGLLVGAAALLPVSALARGALLAVAAISFPVWYDLNLGNVSIVLFALSAVIWRFRDGPAGALALALAGVVRYPFGIVLVGWVAGRRWRSVAWTIGAGLVISAATLPFVGIQGWQDYLGVVAALRDVSAGPHNLSLANTAHAIGLPGPDAVYAGIGVAMALGATVFAAVRRDRETAVVVSLTATILFFPFFHPHYLVQLLIPAALLAGRGQWWGLALPLLGWLPGEVMAPIAIVATLAPLLPPGFAAIGGSAGIGGGVGISGGAAPRDAAAGFGTGPSRP